MRRRASCLSSFFHNKYATYRAVIQPPALIQNEYVFTAPPSLSRIVLYIFFTKTYVNSPTGPKNMHPRMHGTTARCGIPTRALSWRKNRAVNRSNTMKCAHPANTAVESENTFVTPSAVVKALKSSESTDSENNTHARVAYSSEYATATASVMVFVCLHLGSNTIENHAGSDPRFTALRIWLCVNGRKGIGPATATALFAFAAAKEAPAWCGGGRERYVRTDDSEIFARKDFADGSRVSRKRARTNAPTGGSTAERSVSRRERRRTRESHREGRDTDDERGV